MVYSPCGVGCVRERRGQEGCLFGIIIDGVSLSNTDSSLKLGIVTRHYPHLGQGH